VRIDGLSETNGILSVASFTATARSNLTRGSKQIGFTGDMPRQNGGRHSNDSAVNRSRFVMSRAVAMEAITARGQHLGFELERQMCASKQGDAYLGRIGLNLAFKSGDLASDKAGRH
jgi:hypothetical protein